MTALSRGEGRVLAVSLMGAVVVGVSASWFLPEPSSYLVAFFGGMACRAIAGAALGRGAK